MMELMHRYSELKQRMISEQFGGFDVGLVSRDRRAIRKRSRLTDDPNVISGYREAK
jgi:hypothetical protein